MKKVGWLCALLVLAIVPAQAVIPEEIKGYDPNYIQIDGDVNPATGSCLGFLPCSDWTGLANLDPGHLLPDTIGNNDADILSPDSVLSDGSSLPKQDITRIWLSNNKDYFYLAEERRANNGTSGWHVFVTHLKPHWVLGDVVTFDFCNYDMEIFICFPSGGKVEDADITVNRIYDPNQPPQALMYAGVKAEDIWDLGVFEELDPQNLDPTDVLFAINGVETPAINGAIDSKGNVTTTPPYNYPAACFAEAAISLLANGMNVEPCGTKAYVTVITRSSCKTDRAVGDLKDISYPVLYNFGGPDLEVDPPEMSCTNFVHFSATASGGIAPYIFEWYDGDPNVVPPFRTSPPKNDEPATDEFDYSLPAGIHNVHVVVTDSSECSDEGDTPQFTVYDPLDVELTKPIVPDCENKADLSATAYDGAPPYTFKWYDKDVLFATHQPGGATDTINDYVFDPGEHTIKVVVTDSRFAELGCSDEDQYGPFTVYELLTVDLQAISPDCENKADLSATAGGGKTPYTFKWYDKDVLFATHQPGGATDTIDDYVFDPGDHTIKVVVTDDRTSLNCSKEDAEGPFTVYELLDVTLTHSVPTCDGTLTWTATPSGGKLPYSYVWKIDGGVVNGDNPTLPYGPNADCQTYEVSVTVTDSRTLGCSDSDKENVHQEVTTTFPP
jgi:hypothetical protein